jgi:hypothetical protein
VSDPEGEATKPLASITPGQQAIIDQNLAAANEAADKLIEMLTMHMVMHDCPGAWCVSQQFGEGVVSLLPDQLMVLVTIMSRRLVENRPDQEVHPDIPSS